MPHPAVCDVIRRGCFPGIPTMLLLRRLPAREDDFNVANCCYLPGVGILTP